MRLLFLVVFLYTTPLFAQDVLINKYRNGGQNLIDTVEVLVVRDNFDLRGYVLRDFATSTNSFNADSVSSGSYRFANTSLWQRVPAGTLLVLSLTNGMVQKLGDTVISVGLKNTAYFIETGRFDIAADDMVMIKRPNAAITGTEGNVHAFCTGPIVSANISGIVPLLSTFQVAAATTNPFAVPSNLKGDTTDYNGNQAGTAPQARFGIANNPANQRFLDSLRRVRTSVQDDKQTGISRVVIAPQPTSSDCTVNFRLDAAGAVSIALVDMLGNRREIYTQNHSAEDQSLRLLLSDVAIGTYFLAIKAGNVEWREKVVIGK
ncbi:MAG: T9SS type A sorting domain-containing protein [Ignavibacteria bacterium]|nr:T9SS type A sorting domain-containing protein [Ignavibacteria bacterium]